MFCQPHTITKRDLQKSSRENLGRLARYLGLGIEARKTWSFKHLVKWLIWALKREAR